ncbi:hypothetical protein C8R42DRAFT_691908 [Lentinula raphanica]|nr:hypothetical protein C8R42DRAFT_691908 [Lentinula raphanica]
MLLFAPIASGFRRVFRLMLRSVLSLFSPRGLAIQILVMCLLSVTVFPLPMDLVSHGSTNDGVGYDIFLQTLHGGHMVLLIDNERFCRDWNLRYADLTSLIAKEDHIGRARFLNLDAARQALDEARKHADETSRVYPDSDSELNAWRYSDDVMLHLWPSLDAKTRAKWEATLPERIRGIILTAGQDMSVFECYASEDQKTVIEATYLLIGHLFLRRDGVQHVQPTDLVSRYPIQYHIGTLMKDINLDQLRARVDSEKLKFHHWSEIKWNKNVGDWGEEDVERWEGKEREWKVIDDLQKAKLKLGQKFTPYSTSLEGWKWQDGILYALHEYGAITDQQLQNWFVNIRLPCVNRLVAKINAATTKRKKNIESHSRTDLGEATTSN